MRREWKKCWSWVGVASTAVLAMIFLGACGAVISTPTIRDAELAISAAGMEQAEEYATYEYVSAVEYLDKAKEEWSFSDYQHAEEYAARARDFAETALQRAVANPNRNIPGLNQDIGDFEE